ncbi:MAG TPA: hypothetical protein VN721_00910 [Flavipsychrobacter sp.]|nr:hypothetical protein [Flavipsychrobacter sp.]
MVVSCYYDSLPVNAERFKHFSGDAEKWIKVLGIHSDEIKKLDGEVVLAYLSREQRVHIYTFSDDGIMDRLYATAERI